MFSRSSCFLAPSPVGSSEAGRVEWRRGPGDGVREGIRRGGCVWWWGGVENRIITVAVSYPHPCHCSGPSADRWPDCHLPHSAVLSWLPTAYTIQSKTLRCPFGCPSCCCHRPLAALHPVSQPLSSKLSLPALSPPGAVCPPFPPSSPLQPLDAVSTRPPLPGRPSA